VTAKGCRIFFKAAMEKAGIPSGIIGVRYLKNQDILGKSNF
jgi:hypothetical protein